MMSRVRPFWQIKSFTQMSTEEWESLCDGCAKCCLHKLEDEDNGDVYYTDIACRYLDHKTCRCQQYQRRQQLVKECIRLQPKDVDMFYWLPSTCAYRLLAEGKPLLPWHPLVSGNKESIHEQSISVRGKVIAEGEIAEEDYEDRIIHWVD